MKTSIRVAELATVPGPELRPPPSDSHGCQLVPFHMRCHSAPSPPRANTSSRVAEGAAASGSDARAPPSDCQLNDIPVTRDDSLMKIQPLSSASVANRVWLPMATSNLSDPLASSKP